MSGQEIDTEPSDEADLKALIRKDIDPEITRLAKRALRRVQEDDSV